MHSFAIEEFTSWPTLIGFREQWNALVHQQGLDPSHEFEWLATVWDANQANRELLVLLLRDCDGLAGIAAFVKETQRRTGLSVQILRPLGWFNSLHGTRAILGRNPELASQTIFEHLQRKHGDWALWFTQYQTGEEQETLFAKTLKQGGYSFESNSGVRSPYLLIEGTWDEKMKSLQPRFRTALRSREKRIREKGAVELRFLDKPNEWEAGLEAVREIEEESWKIEAGSAITVQEFQWEFYRHYAPIAAEKGTLRIPVLFVGGEPVAYDYALYDRGVYYLMKTSYKNKWQELYPGFVLRKQLMEWSYAEKMSEVDFLGKDEDWKMKWTATARTHNEWYAYNRNWSARYLLWSHHLGTLLRHKG